MKQQTVLPQSTEPQVVQTPLSSRWHWMRYFFTEDVSLDNRSIVDLQRRVTWVGLTLILQSLVVLEQAINVNNLTSLLPLLALFNAFLPLILALSSFFTLWMAFRPRSIEQQLQYMRRMPTRWQRIVLVLMLILAIIGSIVGVITLVMCFLPPHLSNDGTSLDTNAAKLFLQGRNPYTDSSLLDVVHQFSIQPDWTTPLRRGQFAGRLDYPTSVELHSAFDRSLGSGQAPEFESKVSYPALSFLTLVPFVFFQHYNVLPLYLLSYLFIVAIAWKGAHSELRPWILLLALANVPMWSSTIGGNLDIFYSLLIILAWIQRDQRWNSALFFGLALASKQIAWLFIPFYFIVTWRNNSFKEATCRMVIAGSLALVINLPFIIWNPHAWLVGVLAPIADPMFPLGVGIITLSITHLLPYFPIWVYTLLEGCVMLASYIYYLHICRKHPEAAMMLATAPLFFAWRSLPSYFCCTAFPLFVLMACRSRNTLVPPLNSSIQRMILACGQFTTLIFRLKPERFFASPHAIVGNYLRESYQNSLLNSHSNRIY